ncbi:RNase adapter RapZ [Sandaracinobacter sp. RS1-74]|uniref:RNase adapter RapZ n=1 Tax=Sandaracinobacteroides sayramensis TaxID=2913411 RepID=UPI001EDC2F32|nr:RNase adapter RapZ [Sandaracinobacteroides sayramensis]MCG2839980.1 RNase adapter RapZ [Sandaracinobacteroides sayramensis]
MTSPDSMRDEPPPPVLLVTGMSGAGKSTTLKALEDLGYEAVDNLPLSLLEPLLAPGVHQKLAIGIDTRTRAFSPAMVLEAIAAHASEGRTIRMLFVDCSGPELIRRFSETRRRHPLALDRPAGDGIALERELLSELRRVADVVIDTTDFSSNDLRRAVSTRFGRPDGKAFTLTLMSFGYARGVPRDADLVFDMRFLRNPHWVPELRPMTGVEAPVQGYVKADPAFTPAFDAMMGLLTLLLPGYAREGRAYLTVAFGCTGGRHRSVATAEAAGARLAEAGWSNAVVHRDRAHGPEQDALEIEALEEQR